MTPAEQIARVRLLVLPTYESLTGPDGDLVLAVCDLAERALALEAAAHDVLREMASRGDLTMLEVFALRRLQEAAAP